MVVMIHDQTECERLIAQRQVDQSGKSMRASQVCQESEEAWIENAIVPVKCRLRFDKKLLTIADASGETIREIAFDAKRVEASR